MIFLLFPYCGCLLSYKHGVNLTFEFQKIRTFVKGFEKVLEQEISAEKQRLLEKFANAEPTKMEVLDGLINQAACETVYLKELNKQASTSGLVKMHPDDPAIQKSLPISNEIVKHSACLTNIMYKLVKMLVVEQDDDDDGLAEYE